MEISRRGLMVGFSAAAAGNMFARPVAAKAAVPPLKVEIETPLSISEWAEQWRRLDVVRTKPWPIYRIIQEGIPSGADALVLKFSPRTPRGADLWPTSYRPTSHPLWPIECGGAGSNGWPRPTRSSDT